MGTELQRIASFLVVMFMWAVLPGCGGNDGGTTTNIPGGSNNPSTPTGTGAITGRLNVPLFTINSNSALATVSSGEKDKHPTEPDFVPGELLVQLMPSNDDATALAHLLTKYAAFGLTKVGRLYPEGPFRLRTNVYRDATLPREDAKARTEAVLRTLKADPVVEHVGLNYLRYPQQATPIPNVRPNDTAYVNSSLWGQRLIDLPNAWGVSTGRSDVVVAVLDSGIRPDHPELAPLLVPGADFVAKEGLESSGDGDGIDRNATDPGPFPATLFHGTHVAGTIATVSNNGKGLSGVAWGVRIMPVRVLGLFGGSDADIVNGMRWAVGLPVDDTSAPPPPATPAKVINMSLAGPVDCLHPETPEEARVVLNYLNAIREIIQRGVSIVVSAGNEGGRENPKMFPASCTGVIAVGAVDVNGTRSSYSSFHDYVFIAAPGGDISKRPSGGILSAIDRSPSNQPTYGFYQGTSMAAPHVAGVIALMHSAALDAGKTLSDAEIKNILRVTARHPDNAVRDSQYGHGLIQAGAAVYHAKFGTTPVQSVLNPVPYPNPPRVTKHVDFVLSNIQIATVSIKDRQDRDFCFEVSLPNDAPWLRVTRQPNSYDLLVSLNFSAVNGVSIQRSLNQAEFTVRTWASTPGCVGGEAIETFKIPVELSVGFDPIRIREGAAVVRAYGINPATQRMEVLGQVRATAANNFQFAIPFLPAGLYHVEAGTDADQSNQFGDDPRDSYGKYPFIGGIDSVGVEVGKTTTGIDFDIVDGQTILPLD